jgi:CHAP domain
MTGQMSVEAAVARIAELQSAFAPRQAAVAQTTGPAEVSNPTAFASMLSGAQGMSPLGGVAPQGGTAGARLVAAVQGEVGQAEQPPGSNDSPRIAQYRQATAGAPGPGPWCAYFTSWAAQQAGVPIGNAGEGFGSVDAVYAWAQSAGKAIPAGSGAPQPGDLIVWDEHIGVVESVTPDGRIQTIEGNSSDQVARRTYGADGGGALGYVRLG